METYVIMTVSTKVMGNNIPKPYLVCFDKKEVTTKVKDLNKKAKSNKYWSVKVKNTSE